MKKQDTRKLKPEAQEVIRRRLVSFLKSGKGTQKQAAAIFQLSLRAVEKIWQQYKRGGAAALKTKKRGPHTSTAHLSKPQVVQIKEGVKKHTPDSYHLPYTLWTADAVRRLIKKKRVQPTAHVT